MRVGIVSPVLVQLPGVASAWEADAGADELVEIARAADRLGYQHLTCSEHVAVPREEAEVRGGTYWDPLATLSYLAAVTRRLRLLTHVLVLGYHHPLAIAKRYGTLDRLSRGRLVLGVGVGSLREEFELLGASFDDRGPRADDAMRALRAALSSREPTYRGAHHAFEGFVIEPHAVQHRLPLWVGGRTARSLRRAVDLAEGWVPFGLRRAELARMLETAAPPAGFEVVLGAGRPMDPQGDPEGAMGAVQRSREAGATIVNVALAAASASHYVRAARGARRAGRPHPAPTPASRGRRMSDADRIAALERRVAQFEDHLGVLQVTSAYGPLVDAGLAEEVAALWAPDGTYDDDADARPLRGRDAIAAMVRSGAHHRLIHEGCGHVVGPPAIHVEGDEATATCYSLLVRHDPDGPGHRVARLSANRWELRRGEDGWRVTRRTNRLLDGRPEGRELLADSDTTTRST